MYYRSVNTSFVTRLAKKPITAILYIFIITVGNISRVSAQSIPSFIQDSLDNYVERAMQDWKIPGVAICVIKDNKVVVMKGYGINEINKAQPVDSNTLFMLGSISKSFTGTSLAMLVAEQKISLDEKVLKWLPDFTLFDRWVTKEANIKDLLGHRLGFETFQGDFMFYDTDLDKLEVRRAFGKIKPKYSFRNTWGYSNAGYLTAGEIIPKVSGKSWNDFLQEHIFSPLAMDHTVSTHNDFLHSPNRAAAHTVIHDTIRVVPYGNLDNLAPAGGICSSISDMSHWLAMLLDTGRYQHKQVVAQDAILTSWTPTAIVHVDPAKPKESNALYGLGWFIHEYKGRTVLQHGGGVSGFLTMISVVPEEGLGIIALTNTDANHFHESFRKQVIDAYLGVPYKNYSETAFQTAQQEKLEREHIIKSKQDSVMQHIPADLSLQSYAGEYRHALYGTITIRVENNELVLTLQHHTGRKGILQSLGGNRFLCTYNDPVMGIQVMPFTVVKKEGKKTVRSLTLKVPDFVERAPYEFDKMN